MTRQKRSQTSPSFTDCSGNQRYCSLMYEQYRTSNSANIPDRLLACPGNLKVFLSGQLLESEEPGRSKIIQTA